MRSSALSGSAGVPPAAGITASCRVAYHIAWTSVWVTYAMLFPSGLHAGESSEPGLVVSRRRVWPRSVLSAATIQRSLLRLLSGSSVRLLLNATSFPSGDHAPSPSS